MYPIRMSLAAGVLALLTMSPAHAQGLEPNLRVTMGADGSSYDVEATVTAPNSCYVSGGAEQGVPDGVATIPEAEPVTLTVIDTSRPGRMCLQVQTPIHYMISGIPISTGKSSVAAFTVLEGEVVGGASAVIPEKQQVQAMAVETGDSKAGQASGAAVQSVSAWINAMPPEGRKIIATITMWAPCIGYSYDVSEVGPHGTTGRSLLIQVTATQPDECPMVPETKTVRFTRQVDANEFDSLAVAFQNEIIMDALETVH